MKTAMISKRDNKSNNVLFTSIITTFTSVIILGLFVNNICFSKQTTTFISIILLVCIIFSYFNSKNFSENKYLNKAGLSLILILLLQLSYLVSLGIVMDEFILLISLETFMQVVYIFLFIKFYDENSKKDHNVLCWINFALFLIIPFMLSNYSNFQYYNKIIPIFINIMGYLTTMISVSLVLYLHKSYNSYKKDFINNFKTLLILNCIISISCIFLINFTFPNCFTGILYLIDIIDDLILYKILLSVYFNVSMEDGISNILKESCKLQSLTSIGKKVNINEFENFINCLNVPLAIYKNQEICFLNKSFRDLLNINYSNLDNLFKYNVEFFNDTYNLKSKKLNTNSYSNIKLHINKEHYVHVNIDIVCLDDGYFCIRLEKDEKKQCETLKSQIQEFKIKDKLRTEFFANLSHELRTPINVIYSALQILELKSAKLQNGDLGNYIPIIKKNCLSLLRLINNLIDCTKIDAGYYKTKLSNNNIVEFVEDIVTSVANYVKQNNMDIVFDTNVEEKNMAFDKELMERILFNLISNSVKYKKQGYGNIFVDLKCLKNKVSLSINDNGVGISKKNQKDIFKRFVQVETKDSRKKGSGIGLSLVKSMVEMQGGNISLTSKEGKGTEFIIELPCTLIDEKQSAKNSIEKMNINESINIEFSDLKIC